ncbi:MAG: Serotype-specific antigen 1 [Gammaproteobacteria bacterium]|nr:Serotype-specific antigen 1 [Gammaproteobacteria bacterium]
MCAQKIFVSLFIFIMAASSHAATIAVLDTGVNPVEWLAPFVEQPGFNAIDGSSDTADRVGHGTFVAAYAVGASNRSATILPVKVSFGNGIPLAAAVNGINFASGQSRVRVLNISFGGGPFNRVSFTALASAVNRGKLVVMAAGNDGAPGPVQAAQGARLLQGGGIAVGAIDNKGVIRPYSNRAGNNRNFYLVAQDDPWNLNILGTSFSAPIVSGLGALIFERSPHLTGRQVASILFRTAIDLGEPGVDPVYGRGAVNPDAALSPVGVAGVPLSRSTSGPLALLNAEGIGVAQAFGAALAENSRLLGDALVLDEFERGFRVDLRPSLLAVNTTPRLRNFFASLERNFKSVDMSPLPGLALRIWHQYPDPSETGWVDRREPPTTTEHAGSRTALSLTADLGGQLRYRMALNRPPKSLLDDIVPDESRFLARTFSATPFSSFGDIADSADMTFAATDSVNLSLASVLTRESDAYGRESLANLVKGAWRISDRGSLMAQAGHLQENGSLLGGSSSGAFSVAETNSISLLVGGRWKFWEKLSLFGYYGQAVSQPDTSELGLIEGVSTIRSETFGLGLTYEGLMSQSDRFGFAVTRPLRVIDGSADLSVPQSRDLMGTTTVEHERISLVPQAAQTDFNMYYYVNAGDGLRIGGHFLYTSNPSHSDRLSDAFALFATVSGSF